MTPAFLPNLDEDPRLRASVERLMRDDYEVARVMSSTLASDWPGDLAGRLLLSLGRYARAGIPTLDRAMELNDAMLGALEERGYLGPEVGEIADEQQIACHGWVVAGLLQHFYVTGDQRSRTAAFRALDELIVPALRRFDYPWERENEVEAGEPSGTATQELGGWSLSSDVWCVLLTLNGLVPAAMESRRADLVSLIDRLIEIIGGLDVVGHRAQLHAVLAGARNLADWALESGDSRAASVAVALYDDYTRAGRTLNHATYNWFGRPDTWTEPCAIVDSLGLAISLHQLTGDPRYRVDATRIARNGLDFAERKDGSFGLDTIATPEAPILTPIEPDAHWCCTIRGAVGLLEARETAASFSGGVLTISDFYPGTHFVDAEFGKWRIRQFIPLPVPGLVGLEVLAAPFESEELAIEVVIEGARAECALPTHAGARAFLELDFASIRESVQGGEMLRFGPVVQVEFADLNGTRVVSLSDIAGGFDRDERPQVLLIPSAIPSADGRH